MSKIKHTPTPWATESRYSSHIHIIPAEDTGKSIGANYVDAEEHRRKFCRQIANLPMPPYEFDGISVEEQKANAAFIVHAVNFHDALLAACRRALVAMNHMGDQLHGIQPNGDVQIFPIWDEIRSVIAKVEAS